MFLLGLISSDPVLCGAVSEQLQHEKKGLQLALFPSLEEALEAWQQNLPHAILLDWDDSAQAPAPLWDKLVAHLEASFTPPFFMILGRPPSWPQALDVMTLTRPFRLGALLGLLEEARRPPSFMTSKPKIIGPWLFTPNLRLLQNRKTGQEVRLTDKETALLDYFYLAQGPCARDEILTALWGSQDCFDTHRLDAHLYRLRRKIMDQNEKQDVFLMEQGLYRFNPLWRGKGDS